MRLPFEEIGEAGERAARPCLDGSERNVEELRNLALGETAPVGELDQLPLVVRQLCEGAMHPPGGPARLGAFRRARILRRFVDRLRGGLAERTPPVDDCVAGDGVQPGRAGATILAVAPGRAPHRSERLLDGILGPPPVTQAAERERKDGSA